MTKRIVILTGDELRHQYFRVKMSIDDRFTVVNSYCETDEMSLTNRTLRSDSSSWPEIHHAHARDQAEKDFFGDFLTAASDTSNPVIIPKGSINDPEIVSEIANSNADLLVCYGASLIKPELIGIFDGRFLNVHLGISPQYKGSGTNIFPIIEGKPEFVGATFMHIDQGIDTGKIIHQIQADFFIGDNVHTVGNRLIRKMTGTYADIVANFEKLTAQSQPSEPGKTYYLKDFNNQSCEALYSQYQSDLVEKLLRSPRNAERTLLVRDPILK